jgi:hypothetical protein
MYFEEMIIIESNEVFPSFFGFGNIKTWFFFLHKMK